MPVHQSIGIVLAALVAAISIPKIVGEVSTQERLARKLKSLTDVFEKVENEAARLRIKKEVDILALRLASSIEVRPSKRDWAESLVVIAIPVAWATLITLDERESWIPGLALLVIYPPLTFIMNIAGLRLQTLQFNRTLYVLLGAPAEPPLLAVPSLRDYILRTTITPQLVLKLAHSRGNKDSESEQLSIAEVREAITVLEGEIYKHKPRRR
ncbi:hypothetical protein AB0H60_10725 [Nocardia rhamnosiphila]|uniref:hypothetical protein n=1 Tax=Nocardia rhamnosiphila TaxID=426716 RepID=UPI0033CC313D